MKKNILRVLLFSFVLCLLFLSHSAFANTFSNVYGSGYVSVTQNGASLLDNFTPATYLGSTINFTAGTFSINSASSFYFTDNDLVFYEDTWGPSQWGGTHYFVAGEMSGTNQAYPYPIAYQNCGMDCPNSVDVSNYPNGDYFFMGFTYGQYLFFTVTNGIISGTFTPDLSGFYSTYFGSPDWMLLNHKTQATYDNTHIDATSSYSIGDTWYYGLEYYNGYTTTTYDVPYFDLGTSTSHFANTYDFVQLHGTGANRPDYTPITISSLPDGNYLMVDSVHYLFFTISNGQIVGTFNPLLPVPKGNCSDGIKNQDETDIDIGGVCQKLTHNPVLIIPGVLGTEISKPLLLGLSEKLWLDIARTVGDIGDQFMDPLQFNTDLTPTDTSLVIDDVIRKKVASFVFDYTDGLLSEFKNQGYEEGKDIFLFPYDWRYGVDTNNVNSLKQKIEEVRIQTGSDKVDIIAHSTGGLLIKKYVMDNQADNHIGKAVFVGVPNTGAPQAIKTLLQGSNFGVPFLADEEMKKIAKNLPVVYDLSPSEEYYNSKGSYIIKGFNQPGSMTLVNGLNFNQSNSFLTDEHGLNSQALSNAQNLHTTEFDSFDMRNSGVDLYSINGCKTGTTKRILENSNKDNLGNISITYDLQGQYSGDGTVPLESSGDLPINQANEYYALKSDHSKMLSLGGIRQEIVNLISGSNLATKDILGRERITQDISKCELSGDYYKMKSPVDIDVTDQDGNHSGLINGAIQNDIPNANFEIMGDHKFVYLPNDEGQKYTINLKGTGSGTFTFEREKISGNNITGAEIFSNIPVTTSLIGKVNPGSITTLSLDNNGDGKTDQTVQPSSTINSDQSQDLISPVSKTTITGTIGQSGFYRSNITINISAIDPVIKGEETETSGLLKTNYNLDNTGYKIYSMPASVSGEGQHSLKFFSTDKAGNNEMEQSVTFIIDKKSPEPKISIDPTTKDLKIESTETDATILKSSNTYTITDKSGNTTKLFFQETFSGKLLTYAKLTGVQYNTDKTINLPNSSFVYLWNILKNPQTLLSQTIAVDNTYAIEAVYDIKKDQTTTLLKKKGTTIQKQIFTGLHVSKLTLNKGVVGFEL